MKSEDLKAAVCVLSGLLLLVLGLLWLVVDLYCELYHNRSSAKVRNCVCSCNHYHEKALSKSNPSANTTTL
ncbi:unnamed protein product [Arabidopsis halleri]